MYLHQTHAYHAPSPWWLVKRPLQLPLLCNLFAAHCSTPIEQRGGMLQALTQGQCLGDEKGVPGQSGGSVRCWWVGDGKARCFEV